MARGARGALTDPPSSTCLRRTGRGRHGAMRSAFPDIRVKGIAPSMSAGNMEACHEVLMGTPSGVAGIPATGKIV